MFAIKKCMQMQIDTGWVKPTALIVSFSSEELKVPISLEEFGTPLIVSISSEEFGNVSSSIEWKFCISDFKSLTRLRRWIGSTRSSRLSCIWNSPPKKLNHGWERERERIRICRDEMMSEASRHWRDSS